MVYILEKLTQLAVVLLLNIVTTRAECPSCWEEDPTDNTICRPESDKVSLQCTGTNMVLQVNKCVITENSVLADNRNIIEGCDSVGTKEDLDTDADWTAFTIPLECASSSKDGGIIEFMQKLSSPSSSAGYDDYFQNEDSLITLSSGNSFEFSCSYNVDYDVSNEYSAVAEIHALAEGATQHTGEWTFKLEFFQEDFETTKTEAHAMGDKVYFGVSSTELANELWYTVTDCSVSLKSDSEKKISILENGCPMNPNNYVQLENYEGGNRADNDSMIKFKYNVFEFRGYSGSEMTLTCEIFVCQKSDVDALCDQNAGPGQGECFN